MIAIDSLWKAVVTELNAKGVTWALTFTAARARQARWSLVDLGKLESGVVACAVTLGSVKCDSHSRGGDVTTIATDVVFARKAKADDLASADEILGLARQLLERFRAKRLVIDGKSVPCTERRFATPEETAIDERLLAHEGVDLIAVRLEWTDLG